MNKSQSLMALAEATMQVRLVQTGDDSYHLETLDGNVTLKSTDRAGIIRQLNKIEAFTLPDLLSGESILAALTPAGMEFSSVRGQTLTQVLRVSADKFRSIE